MAENIVSFEDFQRLADEFAENPSLEEYVELRRRIPRADVEMARFAGLEPLLSMREELERHQISPYIVCDVLDGDDRQIDELSLQIMEALIERAKLEKSGKTHLQSRREAIPDGLVDYLIMTMLEAIERYDLSVPTSLLVLIRERLGRANPVRHQQYEKKTRRQDAIFLGVQLAEKGEEPSIRNVAQVLGVQPSTVSRWFPEGVFREEVDRMRSRLGAFGLRGRNKS